MYTSNGVDKTLNNKEGNETCDGVVSDDCKEEFDDLKPVSIGSGCPSAPEPGKCNSDGFISTCKPRSTITQQFTFPVQNTASPKE
jgi:hypothetical protein